MNTFLEELLKRESFNFRRQIEGSGEMEGPDWNHCSEYEFQLSATDLRTRPPSPAGVMCGVRRPTTPHEKLDHVFDRRQLAQSVLPVFERRGRSPLRRGGRSSQSALEFSVRTACSEAATGLARQARAKGQRRW